jgi:flagellar assembly protein FliH
MERMNMSSSAEPFDDPGVSIVRLQYWDVTSRALAGEEVERPSGRELNRSVDGECSADKAEKLIEQARAEGVLDAEKRLRETYEIQLREARASLIKAIADFECKRCDYYARVEVEVVQLALAISAKILHRETQIDPCLLAGLVKIALGKLREGSSVTLRIGLGCAGQWRELLGSGFNVGHLEILEDELLGRYDCVLQTELGDTDMGLDAQLKEVERGFFDLLALKPERR